MFYTKFVQKSVFSMLLRFLRRFFFKEKLSHVFCIEKVLNLNKTFVGDFLIEANILQYNYLTCQAHTYIECVN